VPYTDGGLSGGVPEAVYLRSSIDLSLFMWFEVLLGQIYAVKPFATSFVIVF